MFYFLSQGTQPALIDPDRSSTYLPGGMDGIGIDAAGHIWYRAIESYVAFTADFTFAKVREACLHSATDLYGLNSTEDKAVQDAFAAINVGPPADHSGPGITMTYSPTYAAEPGNAVFTITLGDTSGLKSYSYAFSGVSNTGATKAWSSNTGGIIKLPWARSNNTVVLGISPPPVTYQKPLTYPKGGPDGISGYYYTITVKATDIAKNTTTATFTADVTDPTVASTPSVSQNLHTKHSTITINASDDRTLHNAELKWGGTLLGTSTVVGAAALPPCSPGAPCDYHTSHPFTFDVNWAPLPTGWQTLDYYVYDNRGNRYKGSLALGVDNTNPVVTVSTTGGAAGTITLWAAVTEHSSSTVDFYVDGTLVWTQPLPDDALAGPATTKTASYDFNSTGTHTFRADATDSWYNAASSAPLSFTVNNSPTPPPPPPATVTYNEIEPNDWALTPPNAPPPNVTQIVGNRDAHSDPCCAGLIDADSFSILVGAGKTLQVTSTFNCSDTYLKIYYGFAHTPGESHYDADFMDGSASVSHRNSTGSAVTYTVVVDYILGSCTTTSNYSVNVTQFIE